VSGRGARRTRLERAASLQAAGLGKRGAVMVWLIVAIVVVSVVVVLLAIGWFTFVLLSEVSERFDDSDDV
jgi:hypothetical protein